VPWPFAILKKRHAGRTETRKDKHPHVPDRHHPLDGVCQCCIRSFSGREYEALLSPRKKAHPRTHTHRSPNGYRRPVSGLVGILRISKRYQLKPTALLEGNAEIARGNTYPEIPIAVLQCTSLGLFAYLATALTAFTISGRVCFASHIKHPTNSRKGQSPTGWISSNSLSFKLREIDLSLPELKPNFAAEFSAKSRYQHHNRSKKGSQHITATRPGCWSGQGGLRLHRTDRIYPPQIWLPRELLLLWRLSPTRSNAWLMHQRGSAQIKDFSCEWQGGLPTISTNASTRRGRCSTLLC